MNVISRALPWPEWLDRWLDIDFYKEKCGKHPAQYKTFYCGTCNEEPSCKICWENVDSKQHDGHQVLKVVIASKRTAVEVSKMRELMDVSEIQIYSINGKDIVHLNPPHEQGRSPSHRQPNCLTCRRQLIKVDAPLGFKYCSIACLCKEIKRKREIITISDDHSCPASTSQSLRKRSRKGIPRRAPFK